jgi:hypothetical protein
VLNRDVEDNIVGGTVTSTRSGIVVESIDMEHRSSDEVLERKW